MQDHDLGNGWTATFYRDGGMRLWNVAQAERIELGDTEFDKLCSLIADGTADRALCEPVAVVETPPPTNYHGKSVTQDYIICLEDGKKFKSLKRHLATVYNLTPDQYRRKWGLPADYPMIAPAYAAARTSLAKQISLGRTRAAKADASSSKRSRL